MANCAIPECYTNRSNPKYKDISLFILPMGDDEYSVNWRKKLTDILMSVRQDQAFIKRCKTPKSKIWICEKHYKPSQINHRKYVMCKICLILKRMFIFKPALST